MFAIKLRRVTRSRRGQTMVLGVLGVLLVSIMMLLTLNVGQAVHEKIRIQQLADASTFSTATLEARAFNYFAYTNRANIGALVSASSLHSFMSMASSIPEMFEAAGWTFAMHAGIEFAMCFTCCWPYCFAMCKHCYHGIKDLDAMSNYFDSADDLRDAAKDVDKTFINLIKLLDAHMAVITASQKAVIGLVALKIGGDDITKELKDKMAPKASTNNMGVIGLNTGLFGVLSDTVGTRGFTDTIQSDADINKWVPTEIANGTRWSAGIGGIKINEWFVSDRGLIEAFVFTDPRTLIKLLQKDGKPAKGFSFPIQHEGQGRIIESPDSPVGKIKSGQAGPVGTTAAAYDSGVIMSMGFICIFSMIPMFMTYEAYVASGKSGGKHKDSSSCSGESKHKFRCLGTHLSVLGGCFTLFDAEPDPKKNYGQPVVYAVIEQDLSLMEKDFDPAWEVDVNHDKNGTVTVDLKTSDGPVDVRLSNSDGNFGQGVAMSKAMAYYHLPDYRNGNGWREMPNFFNPYWKAKLHPFRPVSTLSMSAAESAKVLLLAGKASYLPALVRAPLP